MPAFTADDGTELCYHVTGDGLPVVCIPGGPMLDSAYLGDLGGLSSRQQLILLDNRGTGGSQTPTDPLSYRCDRLVDDVEALRRHLGLDRMNLLAHSGGANLAVLYAGRYPERIDNLVLVTPSTWAVGITATSDERRAVVRLHSAEPWYPAAAAAFEAIQAGQAADADWKAITPFTYGRWDEAARAHDATMEQRRNDEAAAMYGADGAFDEEATRTALATLEARVLFLVGERDVGAPPQVVARVAALVPHATVATLSGAGHFPWLDGPVAFSTTVAAFLR